MWMKIILVCFSSDILCYYAAKGRWPQYPKIMDNQVQEMSKKVFAMDDYALQKYCEGIFILKHCYRPFYVKGLCIFIFLNNIYDIKT